MVATLAVIILLVAPALWCCWLTWRQLAFLALERKNQRRLQLKVIRLRRQQQYLLLTLAHPQGKPLPKARAGQHLLLYYHDLQGKPVSRAYSLANDCQQRNYYQLAIKAEDQGRLSQSVFQQLKPGDILCTSEPKGHFLLQTSRQPLVLIAAGVGITPMLAMAYQAIRQRRAVTLVYQCREASQLLYHRLLQRLPRLTYLPVLSQPTPDWSGQSGRIDVRFLLQLAGKDAHYYCCASAAMTEQLAADFKTAAVRHFSYELFSAAISQQSFLISYQPGDDHSSEPAADTEIHADSAGFVSVLDALLAAGANIASDCRGGSCGLCKKRLLCGETKQVLEPAVACRPDEVLTCCIQPLSHLQLADVA